MRFAVDLGANVRLAANARQRLAISRDGRRIAYAGTAAGNTARLYVREVGDLEAVAVRRIDQIGSIFFSPDGQWIGYNVPDGRSLAISGRSTTCLRAGCSCSARWRAVRACGRWSGSIARGKRSRSRRHLARTRRRDCLRTEAASRWMPATRDNDIWIWDINGQVLTRVTFDPAPDENPIWAPDGQRIVFTSIRFGTLNLFRRSADGTGVEERLTEGEVGQRPTSISPDGRWLALTQNTQGDSGYDVMRLGLASPAKVEPLVQTPFFEFNAEVSPDGRWMAYQSLESGEDQIFVRPFPNAPSGRWQVSTAGGSQPAWSRDGRELFYLDASGRLMSVSVNAGSGFQAGTPSVVLSTPYFMGSFTQGRPYDVSRDGRRFLMIKEPDSLASGPQVVVVLNWSEELKRLVPVE